MLPASGDVVSILLGINANLNIKTQQAKDRGVQFTSLAVRIITADCLTDFGTVGPDDVSGG